MAPFRDSVGRSFARTRQGVLLGACFVILIAIAGAVDLAGRASQRRTRSLSRIRCGFRTACPTSCSASGGRSRASAAISSPTGRTISMTSNAARPEVRQALAELSALVTDNPQRIADFENIQKLVDAKFAELTHSIDLNAQGQREQARAFVLSGEGRVLMNELRRVVEAANADESRLLAERTAAVAAEQHASPVCFGCRRLIDCADRGLSIYLVQRNYRAAAAARAELEVDQRKSRADRRIPYRRPEGSQRRDPALRLHRQPRPALAARQHHGLHDRA